MMEGYDVRPRNPWLRSSKFSGGNQQKLVLAREALPEPRLLLVGQPTRGVDIGAIEFIHNQLRRLRDVPGGILDPAHVRVLGDPGDGLYIVSEGLMQIVVVVGEEDSLHVLEAEAELPKIQVRNWSCLLM